MRTVLTATVLVKTFFRVMHRNTKNCSNRSDTRTCKQSVCTSLMVHYQHIFELEGPVGLIAIYEMINLKT